MEAFCASVLLWLAHRSFPRRPGRTGPRPVHPISVAQQQQIKNAAGMINKLVRNLWVAAATLSFACAQTHGAAGSSQNATDAMKAEIEAVNREMEVAFGRKDLLAVAKFYADDARLIGPRGQEVRGRAAIDAYWANIRNPKSWRLEAFDIGGSANEAYQFGRSTLVQENSTGDRTSVTDFVVVWKRGSDGKWKIALDFYH